MTPRTTDRRVVRPEIQALRALAVGAVVLHHFWPVLAPAGYIGVDVFFVVSGYLITGLLLRDLAASGRIRFGRFYARRVRRILPAALLVLAATAAVTAIAVPAETAAAWFRQILASTLFVENWQLLAESQAATTAELASTPVEHYWSLSVEEQFYLAWPLLLVAAAALAVRVRRSRSSVLFVVLAVTTVLSFAASLVLTTIDNNLAYFSTFGRGWEFGVGALLACLPAALGRERIRAAASWAGLALIVASIYLATDVDAFPGLLALLPVLGTAAVIWAGSPAPGWGTTRVAAMRPVQWFGDISYSLYLWHWPVVMLTPFVLGRESGNVTMLALLALSILLAWATTRWVERPIRFGTRRLAPVRTGALVAASTAMVLVLVGGAATASIAAPEQPAHVDCRGR